MGSPGPRSKGSGVVALGVLLLVWFPTDTSAVRRASCNGRQATIVGTDGNDRVRGTTGPDVIVARGGNDFVRSRAGNDVICGGNVLL
jgi:Ca2+-binding RTX toxin-like protein